MPLAAYKSKQVALSTAGRSVQELEVSLSGSQIFKSDETPASRQSFVYSEQLSSSAEALGTPKSARRVVDNESSTSYRETTGNCRCECSNQEARATRGCESHSKLAGSHEKTKWQDSRRPVRILSRR